MKTVRYILLLLCLSTISCSIVPGPESAGTVDVELRIGVDGGGLGIETRAAGSEAETAIHSLRIIACVTADDGTVSVVYCSEKLTGITMNGGQPHVVLTVPEMSTGSATFYVVANEAALGYTDEDFQYGEGVTDGLLAVPSKLGETLYIDEYQLQDGSVERNIRFPKHAFSSLSSLDGTISSEGLPMTGLTTAEVTSGMGPVTVNLERTVAKILVQVENAISSSITMYDRIDFTNFIGDRTYLFPASEGSGRGDVPADFNGYTPLNLHNSEQTTEIPGTTICENFFTAYILPCGGTDDSGLSLTLYRADGTSCTGTIPGNVVIPRNTQMTILAQINEKVGISISFEVLPWKAYNINVPVFD